MGWKIERPSTQEAVLHKIMFEIPQPVGIVVFGPDCPLKQETVDSMLEKARQVTEDDKVDPHDMMRYRFGRQGNIVSVMKNDASAMHGDRHEVISRLRQAGMKSVVGMHIHTNVELAEPDAEATRKQLLVNPPTADGIDYLVTVPDEE